MEFFPFFFIISIAAVLFVLYTANKKRKELFLKLAGELAFTMQGSALGTITISGSLDSQPLVLHFYPKGKNTPPYMNISLPCVQPYRLGLTLADGLYGIQN